MNVQGCDLIPTPGTGYPGRAIPPGVAWAHPGYLPFSWLDREKNPLVQPRLSFLAARASHPRGFSTSTSRIASVLMYPTSPPKHRSGQPSHRGVVLTSSLGWPDHFHSAVAGAPASAQDQPGPPAWMPFISISKLVTNPAHSTPLGHGGRTGKYDITQWSEDSSFYTRFFHKSVTNPTRDTFFFNA